MHYFCVFENRTLIKATNKIERDIVIKNYNKILLILLAIIIGLPLLVSLVFMLPGIQTRMAENITTRLSNDLNTEISIGRVQALPFSGIRLKDLLIRDIKNDTLFFAPRVHSEIDYFSILKKHLYIGRVTFKDPVINLSEYDEGMNFTFLIDSLGKAQPDSIEWHYSVRGFKMENGSIDLSHSLLTNPSLKRDKLSFSDFNIDLSRTSKVNDPIDFNLNHLSLTERSGLMLEGASMHGKIRPDKITINDFILKTIASEININLLELPVNPKENTDREQRFNLGLKKALISSNELELFFKNIPKPDKPFGLSGDISGSLQNIKGRNIRLSWGNETVLNTSFDLTDLTNFKETFIFTNIENLRTTPSDIGKIIESIGQKTISIPPGLSRLGIINYSGNLTGFINDMVAYGTFDTGLGAISTDIGVNISEEQQVSFSGSLSTKGFKLNEVFDLSENMGRLTMHMKINGSWINKNNYFAYLAGTVNQLEWNQYTYRNAQINGLFTHQRFDGSVELKDPNGDFSFDGEIDASGSIPTFQFSANMENVLPDRLNILPQLTDGVVTMSIGANFTGNNPDNLSGEINIFDGLIYTPETSVEIDTLSLRAFQQNGTKKIILSSDFIEGEVTGQYSFNKFRLSFLDMVSHFLPALTTNKPDEKLPLNRFDFEFSFKGFDRLLGLLYPGLDMAHDGRLKGEVDSEKQFLAIDAGFESISYNDFTAREIEFHANSSDGTNLEIVTRAGEINRKNMLSLYNFSVHHNAGRDTVEMNVFWNNWGEVTNSGALYTETAFRKQGADQFYSSTHIQPSTVILNDSVWQMSEAQVRYTPESFSVQGLEIKHADQRLAVNGFMHRESMDGIRLEMDNIDLSQLFGPDSKATHEFGGIADGSIDLKDFYRTPLWSANLSVEEFSFDRDNIGFFSISSIWDTEEQALKVNTSVIDGKNKPLLGSGYINPKENSIDLELELDHFGISFLRTFIGNILQNFEGDASGKLFVTGSLEKPFLTGKVNVDRGQFDVDILQTSYNIKDSIWFYPNEIRFQNLTVTDKFGESGKFKGSIYHDVFRNMVYNLHMNVRKMLVLDTKLKNNPYYYGTVYANGNLSVTGTTKNVELGISGETLENSRFFIPLADTEEAVQSNFIRFISGNGNQEIEPLEEAKDNEYNVDLTGLEVNMEIDVTPQARIEIIFDSTTGDLLSATGDGNIQININRQGAISFFGDYIIDSGEYLFSLQNLVNKKFAINQGGTVNWQGNPYDAHLDLTAVYKLKASFSDLIGPMAEVSTSGNQGDFQRRIPIHCNLMLNGPLKKPGIKFGIEAPTLTESRESYMLDFIASEEEMNRQVLSLLVLNRFYTPDYLRMGSEQGMQTNNAALVTTTEMLSNQLSRWLSNISSDLDVGVSYRPEDNISNEEIEVALSTQIFNNRVSINGNVGYGKYQTNTSKMVGDFDMDVKLNQSGNIRAKAYTRSNDDIIYETSPTTQGIGISFKEEFDKFSELLQKYWNAITGNSEEQAGEE